MSIVKIIGLILAGTGGGGLYAAGEHFGFRPAYLMEVRENKAHIQTVANTLDWLKLENYEKRIDRGVNLTRKECADYRNVAKRLGVEPKDC